MRPGCGVHEAQAQPALPDVVEQNTPEELSPLVDALERARAQQEEATLAPAYSTVSEEEACMHDDEGMEAAVQQPMGHEGAPSSVLSFEESSMSGLTSSSDHLP